MNRVGFTCRNHECVPCKPGTYGDGYNGRCFECPAGKRISLLFLSLDVFVSGGLCSKILCCEKYLRAAGRGKIIKLSSLFPHIARWPTGGRKLFWGKCHPYPPLAPSIFLSNITMSNDFFMYRVSKTSTV